MRLKTLLMFLVVVFLFAPPVSGAGRCPEGQYFNQEKQRCVEIFHKCPRGEEFDGFKCKPCESKGMVWYDDPRLSTGGSCTCGPCQEETPNGCRWCHEDGMECVNGKCVSDPKSPPSHDSWNKEPQEYDYGYASSMEEILVRKKIFTQYIQDTEAQLGFKINRAFAHCECKSQKGVIIYATALGATKAKEIGEKVSEVARRDCGGCVASPSIDFFPNIKPLHEE